MSSLQRKQRDARGYETAGGWVGESSSNEKLKHTVAPVLVQIGVSVVELKREAQAVALDVVEAG